MTKLICVAVALTALTFLTFALPARAMTEAEVETELNFISQLISKGFLRYAELAIKELDEAHPASSAATRGMRARVLVARGKVDEAEAIMSKLDPKDPITQSINLQIANRLYATGEVEAARERYNSFFSSFGNDIPRNPALREDYLTATLHLSRMLKDQENYDGALQAVRRVNNARSNNTMERYLQRLFKIEEAQLLLDLASREEDNREGRLKRAEELAHAVTFHGFDLLFGRAINVLMGAAMVRGDEEAALTYLEDHVEGLDMMENQLPPALRRSQSPLAGMRYQRGRILLRRSEAAFEEGDTRRGSGMLLKAAKDFMNITLKYSESEWAFKAAEAYDEADALAQAKVGRKLKPPENRPTQRGSISVAEAKARKANELFRRKRYVDAIPEYLSVLNEYPEVKVAPELARKLASCYIETERFLEAEAVADYIGERLGKLEGAATEMQRVAALFRKKEMSETSMNLFERFVVYFPEHQSAPRLLYLMANQAKKLSTSDPDNAETHAARAKELYDVLAQRYPQSEWAPRAIFDNGKALFDRKKYAEALPFFDQYITLAKEGYGKANGRFHRASALARMSRLADSLKEFKALKADLVPGDGNLWYNGDGAEYLPQLRERVTFQFARTFATIPEDHQKAEQFRRAAVQYYDEFLDTFPDSDLAPPAMYEKGKLLLTLGDNIDAIEVFDRLAERYPESDEGRNALFSLIKAAEETNNKPVAREAAGKMLAQKEQYGPDEFIRVGNIMVKLSLFREAEACMQLVIDDPDTDPSYLRLASLGLVHSFYENNKFDETIAKGQEMLEAWPNAGEIFDVKLVMVDAHIKKGTHREADALLSDIYKAAQQNGFALTLLKANLRTADLNIARGDEKAAIGGYLTMAFTGVPPNFTEAERKEALKLLKEGCSKGLALAEKLGEKKAQLNLAECYIELFPEAEDIDEMEDLRDKLEIDTIE